MTVFKVPDRPAGRKRAGIDTRHTANAFIRIHPSDVSTLSIHVERPGRTGLQTSRLYALSALLKRYIIREFSKGILDDLDSGQRKVLLSFVSQRAGQHARHAALAFPGINKKVSAGGWNRCQPIV